MGVLYLWAVKSCSFKSFFPWSNDPGAYPFPEHLDGIVDISTGDIIHSELDKRIKEHEKYENI